MQSLYVDLRTFRRQEWQQIWPTSFLAVIGVFQLLLTFLVIGFETWSMVLNIKHAFLFLGYSAAFFYTLTWISTFTVVCCNRASQCWAKHAFIENVLSAIASSFLLYYDARFIREPSTCIWPNSICFNSGWSFTWSTWRNNYTDDVQHVKVVAIKGQVACTAIMLVSCVLYILIYIYTSLKVGAKLAAIYPQDTIEVNSEHELPPPVTATWLGEQLIKGAPSRF